MVADLELGGLIRRFDLIRIPVPPGGCSLVLVPGTSRTELLGVDPFAPTPPPLPEEVRQWHLELLFLRHLEPCASAAVVGTDDPSQGSRCALENWDTRYLSHTSRFPAVRGSLGEVVGMQNAACSAHKNSDSTPHPLRCCCFWLLVKCILSTDPHQENAMSFHQMWLGRH